MSGSTLMMGPRRREPPRAHIRSVLRAAFVTFVAVSAGVLGASAARAQACEPSCRDGYVCVGGACISPCNPACAAGEYCRADGECLPVEPADRAGRPASVTPRVMPTEVIRHGRRRGIATTVGAALYVGLVGAAARAEARDSRAEIECENSEVTTFPIYECSSEVERDLYLPELPLLGAATLALATFWAPSLRAGTFANRAGYPGSRALRIVGILGFALTAIGNVALAAGILTEPEERIPPHLYYLSAGVGGLSLVAAAADAFLGARQARFEAPEAWSVQVVPLRDGAALALRGRLR